MEANLLQRQGRAEAYRKIVKAEPGLAPKISAIGASNSGTATAL